MATAQVEVCTGIAYTNANNLIHVYPNPAKNNFTIELTPTENDQDARVLIYDMTGREIFSSELILNYGQRSMKVINTRDLKNGTFLIKIKIRDNLFYRRIVIVK
ncbi:MAG: T9SS type A sorting domain-containing protein [Bacteroidetes bacterium]|nr:T9SS type A sorting domain-containing protein [Bacteroidota bacterium]MBL0096475.1 T9SS type A sorting domain-containing protein [Bacteroidota bacterium]